MSNSKILLFKTPVDEEVQIDAVTYSNREFLEEVLHTMSGIKMYNETDGDSNKIFEYYLNLFNSGKPFPQFIVIKFTTDLLRDDYVLEHLYRCADFVFSTDSEIVKYESLEYVCEEFALEMYNRFTEIVNDVLNGEDKNDNC